MKRKTKFYSLFSEWDLSFNDLPDELWISVINYDNLYRISCFGRLKALNIRGNGIQGIITPKINTSGYPMYRLSKNGILKNITIHRLLAIHFIENPDNLPQVNHIDGNKINFKLNNLEWVTSAENMSHFGKVIYKTGQWVGFRNQNTKLTKEIVQEIRYGKYYGMSITETAKILNLSWDTINRVKRGITWNEDKMRAYSECR